MEKTELYGITNIDEINLLINRFYNVYISHIENGFEFPFDLKEDFVLKLVGKYLLYPEKESLKLLENPNDLFIDDSDENSNICLINGIKTTFLGQLVKDKNVILETGSSITPDEYYENIDYIFDSIIENHLENYLDYDIELNENDSIENVNYSNQEDFKENKEIENLITSESEDINEYEFPDFAKYIHDKISEIDSLEKDKSNELVKDTEGKLENSSNTEDNKKTKEFIKDTKTKIDDFYNREDVQDVKNQLEQQLKSIFDFGKSKLSEFTNEKEPSLDFDNTSKENIESSEANFIDELLFKIFNEDINTIEQEDISIAVGYILNNGQKSELGMGIKAYSYGIYLVLTSPQKLVIDNNKHFKSLGTDGSQVLHYYLVLAQ